jgi:hypothetical protein
MNNLNNKNNNQAIRTKPKIPYVKRLVEEDKHHQVSTYNTFLFLMWASCKSDRNVIRHEVAKVRKLQVSKGLRNLASNLFPNERPSKVVAHVVSAESVIQDDKTYWCTYSGLLTHTPKDWIAGTHRQTYRNQTGTPNRRSHDPQSRKQAAARRHHYYDKISRTLGLDQGTMSSTEVGAKMADGLLQYYKDATNN